MRLETLAMTVDTNQRRRQALLERITVDAIMIALIGIAFVLATHL